MIINFSGQERWDGSRCVVTFAADSNGIPVSCAISSETLRDNFGASDISPMQIFKSHRDDIEKNLKRSSSNNDLSLTGQY